MSPIAARSICSAVFASALILPLASPALSQSAVTGAPVPVQIRNAHKVFISNGGGGCTPFGKVGFSGGADRAYNQFYAEMKAWGHYELVGSPAEAELDFEIRFSCPAAASRTTKGESTGPSHDPQLRLEIVDIRTHIMLWGITQHVEVALLEKNRDKNFDLAMDELVKKVKRLVS
jgi:hypothetical protein